MPTSLPVHLSARFKRELKREHRRGRDVAELWAVVDELRAGRPLDPRRKVHPLSGSWSGHWECHIKPDWLLVWRYPDDETLLLAATGTHRPVRVGRLTRRR